MKQYGENLFVISYLEEFEVLTGDGFDVFKFFGQRQESKLISSDDLVKFHEHVCLQ